MSGPGTDGPAVVGPDTPDPVGDGAAFEAERPRLVGLAYRMLGSWVDAEDVVQAVAVEWLQLARPLTNLPGWLTRVTVRRSIDALRRRKREPRYVGPWLPEPLVTEPGSSPEEIVEREAAVTMTFLLLAEVLSPPQRAVVVLRSIGYPHSEIAGILGIGVAASRQHHTRAMKRLAEENGQSAEADATVGMRAGTSPDGTATTALLHAFLRAARDGDSAELTTLLHDQVVAFNDGGGQVKAARWPLYGRVNVARFAVGVAARYPGPHEVRPVLVNGEPGVVLRLPGAVHVISVQVRADRIFRLFDVSNPAKHTAVPLTGVIDTAVRPG